MNKKDLKTIRFINNGLIDKFEKEEECVEKLNGIQCQYQNYSLISIYNRTIKFKRENIFKNEDLIKSWGQRTTLHIYIKNDYNLLSELYKNKDNWIYKYAHKLDLDINEYMQSIDNYLNTTNKIIDKKEIESIIPQYKAKEILEWSGLIIVSTYNKILYGLINEEDLKLYKKNDINLEKNNDIKSFIKRYFVYYGPATKDDFIHWSGLNIKDINKDLNSIIKELNIIEIENKKYYYYGELPNIKNHSIKYPIILGKFDPLLVCYEDKDWILDGKEKELIWKIAGQIEGIIVFKKGLKATWHYKIKGKKMIFEVYEIIELTKSEKNKIKNKFLKISKIFNIKNIEINYTGR